MTRICTSAVFYCRLDSNVDNEIPEDGDDVGDDVGNYHDVFEYEDKKLNPISCEVCHYRTSTMSQLRKHMVLFHQDQVSGEEVSGSVFIQIY